MKTSRLLSARFAILVSIVLYVVCVGLMFLFESKGWAHGTTAEMIYGPAITIASCWIIFAIVYALVRRQ
jgi:hypothetical protein